MSSAEIAEIVSTRAVQDACKALVQLAKERGGPDNITLQVLRVS
jgi:serine/threonine protein phosphatase PrpC